MGETKRVGSVALVLGFATACGMWMLGFLARIPPAFTPSSVLLALFVALMVAAGFFAGRHTGAGARGGAATGAIAALINLLVLGSLISGDEPNQLVPSAAIWIPGSVLVGTGLGALGGALAPRNEAQARNWNATFSRLASLATLFMVMIGGLVTSQEAGLAVVDWPNSFGYNMFLYPFARMVGGIYYEHAHRLFGTLIGLITVTLAVRLWATDSRQSSRILALSAVVLVIGQGILGGLRVTGHFTMSDSPEITRPNLLLAMVHGVLGQIFFGVMVALAAITSTTWWRRTDAAASVTASTDRSTSILFLVVLLVQLVLGVRTRHTGEGVMIHMTFAVVVLTFGMLLAARTLAKHSHVTTLRKTGGALLGHLWVQVILGVIAFIFVNRRGEIGEPTAAEVFTATAHQTLGAILLGNAVLFALWGHRLLSDPKDAETP